MECHIFLFLDSHSNCQIFSTIDILTSLLIIPFIIPPPQLLLPVCNNQPTNPNASSTITTESNENIFIFWPQKSPSKSPPLELQNTTNQLTNRNLPHDHQIKWPGSLLSGKNWNTGMRDPNSPHLLLLLLCNNGPENAQNIKIFVKPTNCLLLQSYISSSIVIHHKYYNSAVGMKTHPAWRKDHMQTKTQKDTRAFIPNTTHNKAQQIII